jgi:hypothetical protein
MFRCGILKRPLERMVVGGLFTASAFFISGFLGTVSPSLQYILTVVSNFCHLHLVNLRSGSTLSIFIELQMMNSYPKVRKRQFEVAFMDLRCYILVPVLLVYLGCRYYFARILNNSHPSSYLSLRQYTHRTRLFTYNRPI